MDHAPVRFRAEWDTEAAVWWVAQSSYPGLHAEGDTLDALVRNVRAALADLREVNADPDAAPELVLTLAA